MASEHSLIKKLNPAQLELLQLFAGGLSESQFSELKEILIDFKFKRVTALADKFVEEKGWSHEDIAKDAQNLTRLGGKNKIVP